MDEGWKKDVRGSPGRWGGWGAAEREEEPAVQNTRAVLLLSRVYQNHFEGDGAGTGKNTDACTPMCAPLKNAVCFSQH